MGLYVIVMAVSPREPSCPWRSYRAHGNLWATAVTQYMRVVSTMSGQSDWEDGGYVPSPGRTNNPQA